jgi:hypothetical protein
MHPTTISTRIPRGPPACTTTICRPSSERPSSTVRGAMPGLPRPELSTGRAACRGRVTVAAGGAPRRPVADEDSDEHENSDQAGSDHSIATTAAIGQQVHPTPEPRSPGGSRVEGPRTLPGPYLVGAEVRNVVRPTVSDKVDRVRAGSKDSVAATLGCGTRVAGCRRDRGADRRLRPAVPARRGRRWDSSRRLRPKPVLELHDRQKEPGLDTTSSSRSLRRNEAGMHSVLITYA